MSKELASGIVFSIRQTKQACLEAAENAKALALSKLDPFKFDDQFMRQQIAAIDPEDCLPDALKAPEKKRPVKTKPSGFTAKILGL